MKKGAYIFLLFLGTYASGQDSVQNTLVTLRAGSRQPDTTYILRLLDVMENYLPRPTYDSLAREVLRLSGQLNYGRGKVTALAIKAELDNNLSMAQQALAIARKSRDSDQVATVLYHRSRMAYEYGSSTSSLPIIQEALEAETKGSDPYLRAKIESQLAFYHLNVDENYPSGVEHVLTALSTLEKMRPTITLANALRTIGNLYTALEDTTKSLGYLQRALAVAGQFHARTLEGVILNDLGDEYALFDYTRALQSYLSALTYEKDDLDDLPIFEENVAYAYAKVGNNSLALLHGFISLRRVLSTRDVLLYAEVYRVLALAYLQSGNPDSALYYANVSNHSFESRDLLLTKRDNAEVQCKAFVAKRKYDSAFYYYKLFITDRDSLNSHLVKSKVGLTQYNYDLGKKQSEIDLLNKDRQLQQAEARRQRTALISALAGLALVGVVLFLIARNNRQRRRAYGLLQRQKQEIQDQRDQTAQALRELRQTQQQLIQSEKMASLGELTAGVAHEIQNPLNFVNNFAELNIELLAELKAGPLQALSGPTKEEADGLIADISDNLAKIAWHGGRAGAIVKGMLAHSRTGSGAKEPTDLNALADECLRLSYHGYRARQKSFNANLVTNFDPAVGLVDLVPQDIGRVLLNLCTNAFYSLANKSERAESGYQPTVALTTNREGGNIVIMVRDNGLGIPAAALDKIYQPFFTTKPSGEGTGLGLSLSYDIIKKGHGGELTVDTKDGEYATFTITLPG